MLELYKNLKNRPNFKEVVEEFMEREKIKNTEGKETVKVENDGITVKGELKMITADCLGCKYYNPCGIVICDNPRVCVDNNQYKLDDMVIKKAQNVSSNAGISFSELQDACNNVTAANIDMVNHPQHYKTSKGLETIDVIEAFTEGLEGIEATDTGNIIKYACRWKRKNGVEDLEKIVWYATHLINHLKENGNKEEKYNIQLAVAKVTDAVEDYCSMNGVKQYHIFRTNSVGEDEIIFRFVKDNEVMSACHNITKARQSSNYIDILIGSAKNSVDTLLSNLSNNN